MSLQVKEPEVSYRTRRNELWREVQDLDERSTPLIGVEMRKAMVDMWTPIKEEEREEDDQEYRKDWTRFSQEMLSRAWDEDEPDFSDIPLKKRNPNYDPEKWKKGRSS